MATILYRPMRARTWFVFHRTRTWLAADHLLIISDRFFRENYSRIYWTDMQTILLYSLQRPRGPMLAFEILCVGAVQVSGSIMNILWGSVFAALFVFAYASWRLMQPNWGCQTSTKLSTHRFSLGATLNRSRRIVEDLKTCARSVQGSVKDVDSPGQIFVGDRDGAERRKPTLAVHVIAFVLGLLAPLSRLFLAIYYGALIAVFFFQRDFQSPLAVRSATVMSHLLALLQIAWWVFWLRYRTALSGLFNFSPVWEFHILRLLFSVFGLAAVYQEWSQNSRYQPKSSSVLGLS